MPTATAHNLPFNYTRIFMLKIALFFVGVLCTLSSFANIIEDTVYINRGTMMAVDSTYIPYFAFNSTPLFDKENKRLILDIGDTMLLTVVNTDTISHGFDIKGNLNIATIIPTFGTAVVTFSFSEEGAHIYYDHSASQAFRYMGLGGMIVIKNSNSTASSFFGI